MTDILELPERTDAPKSKVNYERLRAEFDWSPPLVYNIGAQACARAAGHPQDTALIVLDRGGLPTRHSYAELERASNRLANRLLASGNTRGDRVAVMLPSSFECAAAHIAALKAGLVVVPLYPGATADAVIDRLVESRAKALMLDQRYLPLIQEAGSSIETRHIALLALRDGDAPHGAALEQALGDADDHFDVVQTSLRDPAYLTFTSGSEGKPKGVLHGHSEVFAAHSTFALRSQPPQPGDVAWTTADWSWLMGVNIAMLAWHTGGTVLVQQDGRFDPVRAMKLMADFDVRHASLPPTALTLIRKMDTRRDQPRLLSLATGGEALPIEIFDWVKARFGIVLDEFYGMSECPALVGNGNMVEARRGSMGLPLPGHDLRIVDEGGQPLADGEIGFIAIHKSDPGLFLGYWQGGQLLPPRFTGDYYVTSDLAYKDAEGYFWYVGRGDDVIKSGGHRIGPGEIEDCAIAHPAVKLAGAVGVNDPIVGHVVKLWVELSDPRSRSDDLVKDINAHLRQRLSTFQWPRSIAFIDAMPLTANGKINRRELRALT